MCERYALPAKQPTQWSRRISQISHLLSYTPHYTRCSLNAYTKSNTLQNKFLSIVFFLVDTLCVISNKSCRSCYILHVCYVPMIVQETDILPISKPPKLNLFLICLRNFEVNKRWVVKQQMNVQHETNRSEEKLWIVWRYYDYRPYMRKGKIDFEVVALHSHWSLSYDRSTSSSKTISPYNAI
jgi:hypothetical protein